LRGQLHDLRYFVIATGLLTGAKASNFPLLLPLFLLFCPRWKLLFLQPLKNFFVIVFAALASFLPTAILNLHYAHDWTGMNLEGPMKTPISQFGINVTNWLIQNLAPPIFPFAGQWDKIIGKIPGLSFEAIRSFAIPELAVEENSGLGVGIVLLLIISALASRHLRRKSAIQPAQPRVTAYWKWVIWSPFIGLMVFAFKAQVVHSATRLILPYYALLIVPCLLFGFDARLFRRGWWKSLVAIVFGVALLLTILAPARPLWPANSTLAKLKQSHPSSKLIARVQSVYSIYQNRANGFAPLVAALPKDANVFGLFTFDDPETSLWWPLGSRRIEHVTPEDTREQLASRGIRYVIAPAYNSALTVSADDLIKKYDAKVVAKVPLLLRSIPGKMDWYILDINARADTAQSGRAAGASQLCSEVWDWKVPQSADKNVCATWRRLSSLRVQATFQSPAHVGQIPLFSNSVETRSRMRPTLRLSLRAAVDI
ncbi:MAG TPA: hypothetical protein VFB72_11450, partial [Verrucomicrobiae bacterium]|nr:hypothetical protein [Verrucomicrobiae bacterium]